ncbi:MAG: zf-TFIIB domain-containing protein [Azoarcus sp.]|jgi:Zn-finger nucleic acid-binding protein|nr:zf-TFIIB domain-containing protein [Azoarcus sp.]
MPKLFCACAPKAVFEPCELQPGLSAKRCTACRSVLLAMPDYRAWRDQHFSELPAVEPAPQSGREAPSKARACPSCGRLMSRYRTGNAESFWLDFCPSCERVWLDDGEWETLEQSGLAPYLDLILSEAWQKRVQAQRTVSSRDELLRARFGEDALMEIRRIKAWLAQQPNRRDILTFLAEP